MSASDRELLDIINQRFEEQNKIYDTRRKEDDEERKKSREQRDEIIHRLDGHGKRVTVIETKQEAFFGPQGAYQHLVAKSNENGTKLDRLFWAALTLAVAICGVLIKSILHL